MKEKIVSYLLQFRPFYLWYYTYYWKPLPGTIDFVVNNFSRLHKNIRFVQIGANDGVTNDPIRKFILRDKWSGVLVEPQPYVFARLIKNYFRERQQLKFENAAISDHDKSLPFYSLSFSTKRWASNFGTFNKEVLAGLIDNGTIDDLARKHGDQLPKNKKDYISETQVTSLSIKELFKKYKIAAIDFLQIDTEGYDYAILKQYLNANLPLPKMICFELIHLGEEQMEELEEVFTSLGFTIHKEGFDCLLWNSK